MLEVELSREGRRKSKAAPRAYAPRFPKVKEEGWYLVVGDPSTCEVLVLRRVSGLERTTVRLALPRSNKAGREMAAVQLYLMSGEYIGLDQQYEVRGAGCICGLYNTGQQAKRLSEVVQHSCAKQAPSP